MVRRPDKVCGTPGPGKLPVIFRALTACDCGCGAVARFELTVGRHTVAVADPAHVRAPIAEMRAGYAAPWPDEPPA